MARDDEKPLPTSPIRRMAKIGGLVGRVGSSVLTDRVLSFARSGPVREAKRMENLLRNASRVVETLGEMRGAAMKVGQMLSLQEGLLPPEVLRVLESLQQRAPQVPPEVMRYEIEGSLGAPLDELFVELDEDAYAAASIGQVHRARLPDGRPVAVKVQYPLIREVVTADLANLKTLLRSLFAMVFDSDFEPLWKEMRERLLEELDYRHEAENIRRMRELHRGIPEIVIPEVVADRSSDRVLTMELVEGLSPEEACSRENPPELRDAWGMNLLEFQLRGLLDHRFLHADPNFANFAFLPEGRVVVYDFGSVKEISPGLARSYARVLAVGLDERWSEIPAALSDLGLTRADGRPLEREPLQPYIDLLAAILRRDPPYRFGEDDQIFQKLLDAGLDNWSQATDVSLPGEVIFVQRSLSGHFGNLTRLGAAGPWWSMAERYLEPYESQVR